ncbi:hypothetical protein AVW09_10605 [Microbacterium sp. T32]|nr:hypothetical protein AVW09_10605 [Microbacterium sp. T32]
MARGTEPHEHGIAVAEPRSRHGQPRRFQGGAPLAAIAPLRGCRVDAFRETDECPAFGESSDRAARVGEVRFQVLRTHGPERRTLDRTQRVNIVDHRIHLPY